MRSSNLSLISRNRSAFVGCSGVAFDFDANKFGMMRNLLRGDALRVFDLEAARFNVENDANFTTITHKLVEYLLPPNALITQKRYMRRFMRKAKATTIREF